MTPAHTTITRAAAALLATACFIGCQSTRFPSRDQLRAQTDDALSRGVQWLLKQQSEDGAFRSDTYGNLKSGAASTALTLYALSHLPADQRRDLEPAIRKAVQFLSTGLAKRGYIVNPDGSEDYPVYATALFLSATQRLNRDLPDDQRRTMIEYLLKTQLTSASGWTIENPNYGGWDMLGFGQWGETAHGMTSGTNISVTCFVLEALETIMPRREDVSRAISTAAIFIRRCQNPSDDPSGGVSWGGFHFTPQRNDDNNKAGEQGRGNESRPRSYGTATADGIRALRSCRDVTGNDEDNPRINGAERWIHQHANAFEVPGFPPSPTGQPEDATWARGLWFYYTMTAAKAIPFTYTVAVQTSERSHLTMGLAWQLCQRQRPDGSWINPSARMREDDPLIATTFAIIALSEFRQKM